MIMTKELAARISERRLHDGVILLLANIGKTISTII